MKPILPSSDDTRAEQAAETLASLKRLYAESTGKPAAQSECLATVVRITEQSFEPTQVINTVDDFIRRFDDPADAFRLLDSAPRCLEILAKLASGSSFLTQILLDQPHALEQLVSGHNMAVMKPREQFVADAQADLEASESPPLEQLRRYQRREILRIGMCDAFGLMNLKFVTLQLSLLADAMVIHCLRLACEQEGVSTPPFAVISMGKHGGEELNYSSDIDIVLVAARSEPKAQRVARRMIDGLSQPLATGFLYRVDTRLRPWGDAGALVCTDVGYRQYLKNDARLWEKQALLKARTVAGDHATGEQFLNGVGDVLHDLSEADVRKAITTNKAQIEAHLKSRGHLQTEVKLGAGSIRDIEFLVQARQLIHGGEEPRLASAGTLDALVRLTEFGFLDVESYRKLREGYLFLRTVEHALQLFDNQASHRIPDSPAIRNQLADRLDYPSAEVLMDRFHEHQRSVRGVFDRYFFAEPVAPETPSADTETDDDELAVTLKEQLAAFQPSDIASVQVASFRDGLQAVIVVSVDHLEALAIVSAALFGEGLDIRFGEITNLDRHFRWPISIPDNTFCGVMVCDRRSEMPVPQDLQSRLLSRIQDDFRLTLVRPNEAQQKRLTSFCDAITQQPSLASDSEAIVSINKIDDGPLSCLRVDAADSPGFLFELASSAAVCGFHIRHARLNGFENRVRDEFMVSTAEGRPLDDPLRQEELRTAVTLVKQLTSWLPSSGNPLQSLLSFRDLVRSLLSQESHDRLEVLREPETLRTICRALGVSRNLWEGILKVEPQLLVQLLTEADARERTYSREDLEKNWRTQTQKTHSLAEIRSRLNSFKDDHLFRIDLCHVLGGSAEFGQFSRQITNLAEVVVSTACDAAFESLIREHGQPRQANGEAIRFALAGLGKFGGTEMGFASDIELMLIYSDEGQSDGQVPVANRIFCEQIVHRIQELIEARDDGIFALDLRMRPFGNAGSLAVSKASFADYFAIGGAAWPYERQGLVKLRCFHGDESLRTEIHALRDQCVFGAGFDFAAMKGMREKQQREHLDAGTVNAKLTDGGLVDLEYAVQALQMCFADQQPALQTPNTLAAIDAAEQCGLLPTETTDAGRKAYIFLRQLIDCLRMARGNAHDLAVPATGSLDFQALEQRLNSIHPDAVPLAELEGQLSAVRDLARAVEAVIPDRNPK